MKEIDVKEQVFQLESYKKLLDTTIRYVGKKEASDKFVIVLNEEDSFRCSPMLFVEVEEILVNAFMDYLYEIEPKIEP